ncbi:hypothetical protein FHL15_003557 [Xylaria flabelliformis]|uniref:Uncharacterized protein n=1 Tax=Xylaria flabelliformis TaxID=2512241 RepID=A0A553I5W8_9PEZI|nr:hypothetical protein FHL15_003557 [Xylaria flabelliformis]
MFFNASALGGPCVRQGLAVHTSHLGVVVAWSPEDPPWSSNPLDRIHLSPNILSYFTLLFASTKRPYLREVVPSTPHNQSAHQPRVVIIVLITSKTAFGLE